MSPLAQPPCLQGLKIGTPFTATPIGPSLTDVVLVAMVGVSGSFQALSPVKFVASGTCRLVAVMPFIIACEGRPIEASLP